MFYIIQLQETLTKCLPVGLGTLIVYADVHRYLSSHGQQVVLQSSLQQPVVLLCRQGHLLLRGLTCLQFVPQLLQSCHLSCHRCLGCRCLHGGH